MEVILEKELEHQQKAVDAVVSVLDKVALTKPQLHYQNPLLDNNDITIKNNIKEIQKNIRPDYHGCNDDDKHLNIDVKMETGTGKTYVYTQIIYEMHKRYGFNKFIIAVPSLSIKAGTSNFISDSYVKHHFSDTCGYNCTIELSVLESPKSNKKGFLAMPSAIRNFVSGSCQNSNKIYVLLVNMQLLTSGKLLSRDDYDYLVEGFYRPFDAIKATKPIVIIDEPHRFSRQQNAYKVIANELNPQIIIRFGATFPEIELGKKKNKCIRKDYNNLVYDLNASDSFNKNLIKGVTKEHLEPLSQREEKVKISSIVPKTSVTFSFRSGKQADSSFTLEKNDSLSQIHPAFENIIISGIGNNFIELSNGQTKYQGEEFNTDIYSSSYQEQMLKLAIQRHFETERQNFSDRQFKIKTLALFFIDDISSYRANAQDDKVPYLKEMFERLLKEQINNLIKALPDNESEYKEYLQASLDNISACHAGYFAQDNSDSDEKIAQEVADILHNKKKLISLRNDDGTYNTRRFLFSKWTLKEGWDNPNVFTIAKLRSSGSEISKLQEVGRGLRLPVDENGNRISNEEFQLNYIVDFTEKDFAERLVNEINADLPETKILTDEMLKIIAKNRNVDEDDLFFELFQKKYINRNREINLENQSKFFAEYPELAKGVKNSKITNANETKKQVVHVRKAVFDEIKELWKAINKKYYLFYNIDLINEVPKALETILKQNETFADVVIHSHRQQLSNDGKQMTLNESTNVSYSIQKPIAYNEFLKRISNQTCIPIIEIHKAMCSRSLKKEIPESYINEHTVANIVQAFTDWQIENLQTRFRYKQSSQEVGETALTYKDGSVKSVIKQGRVGTEFIPGDPSSKYLYDKIAFDSPLEKNNIINDIEEVVVYGKIPRSSIAIPTIVGETYSPDFMYVVKWNDGNKELNIIVETKSVENQANLRKTEATKIECAKAFFKQLEIDGYAVSFHTQLNNTAVRQIIEEVIKN